MEFNKTWAAYKPKQTNM